jgi:predicted O-linked N-acetylglucosamine transferase (SPINDLY family)
VDLIRRTIAVNANFPEAHNNLGNALAGKGQFDEAIAAYRHAIVLRPNYAEAYNNLGNALKAEGQFDEAIAACRQAIALRPDYAEAHNNLGNALAANGEVDEAIAVFGQTIALNSRLPEAQNNLGNALKEKGQVDEAIAAYRQAIALRPNYAEAYNNLGVILADQGQLDEAIAAYHQTIAFNPNLPGAYNNLGNALKGKAQLDQAIAAYRQAIALRPDYPEAHSNLGNSLRDKGQVDEAIAACRQAIVLRPDYPEAHNNLGNALRDRGELDEAIAAFRQAIALKPSYVEADSNLVYSLHLHADYDAEAIARENRRWNRQHAEPLRKYIVRHSNEPVPDRRLRIGYVSADFCAHSSAFFLVPLLEHHDPQQVELFCYAHVPQPDAITSRLRQRAAGWRSTVGLSDEQVAEQIRQDRIDILVDLKLHTANNRLLVFARKPAPVQATWLGCPASTGLRTMDYRLSDPYLDPPGVDESVYSEQTIRLPDTFWCYDPLDGRDNVVNSLPALESGFVTFGCLNSFSKINHQLLGMWSQVLGQVANSRLLLLAPQGSHRQRMLDRFGQDGITPGRIEFVSSQPRPRYLETYHRIDVGLDSFPCNGHTTSLDSFWMGVPVVTLVGQRGFARAGWSQLSNLGMGELAGQTTQQFVRIAVELAKDLPRLEELRSTLRRRMEQSPLMDAPRFARNIEAAYRRMWQSWCETAGATP